MLGLAYFPIDIKMGIHILKKKEFIMAMKSSQKATCPKCKTKDVLVCSKCGYCAECSEPKHVDCDKSEKPLVQPPIYVG